MEQHHTPSPSIASLLNPIQPYQSPSPPQNKINKRPKKRNKNQEHNQSSNEINQSILFNSKPSQPILENHSNNNYHLNHQNSNIKSSSSSSSSKTTTTTTTTTLPSTTIETNLEHSIFGIAPYDQFTWFIAQFIWQNSRKYWESGQAHLIEVEAKIGTIRDRREQGERMYYPIGTESPILDTRDSRFQSDISSQQHENLNRLLNQRVTETNSIGYSGSKVEYSHLKQIDEFYEPHIRVSRDWNNNKLSMNQSNSRAMMKEKLAHLDIHCPGRPFDFRISVNVEQPVPLPHENVTPKFHRMKDRVSYTHQICQIDLTQVKSSEQISTHEVEVEFKNSQELLKAASIWAESQESKVNKNEGLFGDESCSDSGDSCLEEVEEGNKKNNQTHLDSNHYLVMIEVMLNNIRMLILNC